MSHLHHCHAIGCGTPCKPEFLMCAAHWSRVPMTIRRRVYGAYRPGQCDDKHVSEAWCRAADEAVRYVAEIEGRTHDVARHGFLVAFHPSLVHP